MGKTKLNRAALIILGCILIGVCGGLLILRKSVTLIVDGEKSTVNTYAMTVASLLRSEKVPVSNHDELQPRASSWIGKDTIIVLKHAIPVIVFTDGHLHQGTTTERLPTRILAAFGITILPGDKLISEGSLLADNVEFSGAIQSISLQVIRSTSIILHQGSQEEVITTNASSLGQALWDAGIKLQVSDRLQPFAAAPLQANMDTELRRGQLLTIITASGEYMVRTAAETIGEALSEAGLALQGLDYTNPPAEEPIPPDQRVRLVQVKEDVIIENTPLAFENAYQADPDLELDSQSILQTGEYGLTARRVRVRYEDGQEISRQTESEWIARQPKPRIVGYGTNVVKKSLSTPDGVIEYYRALTMYATSYCPADVGGNTVTASGQLLRKGIVAINPYYIPYGTKLYVPGYGYAEAADTGLLGPRWIDLGYGDEDYVAWHQNVTVYFLWPPPDHILWIYP